MPRLFRTSALALGFVAASVPGFVAASVPGFALAQGTAPHAHPGHMQPRMMPGAPAAAADQHRHGAAPAPGNTAQSPSTAAFIAANEVMHRDMAISFTGDADRDFAAAMIPHHEGAIAMARIQLAHGRDPGMRSLADAVISAQESEIATLRAFLARPH